MIECLILGDSIAVGTKMVMPTCTSYAKNGWNSWQWNRDYLKNDLCAENVIISLGSNDHSGVHTYVELEKMRTKVKGKRVYWILPAINPSVQEIVKKVAAEYGDIVLPITSLQVDKIHPSMIGYKDIAKRIEK